MNSSLLNLSAYHYNLPPELIAQYPIEPRDASRLMVVHRQSGKIDLSYFHHIIDWIGEDHHLIFNNTKVIPARLFGHKQSGARIEIFLIRPLEKGEWLAMGRPGRKLPVGTVVHFGSDFSATITYVAEDGTRHVKFHGDNFEALLEKYGQIPLPHYIDRPNEKNDTQRYQTIYAQEPGAVAAPTAGLHFTEELLQKLKNAHVEMSSITLHTGSGTFKPVLVDDIRQHQMHYERYQINAEVAEALNNSKKKKVCVGTTSCRAGESAADARGVITAGNFETNIFIYPGYQFKFTEALITNFHLPETTLLMLVSAFAGYELTMKAYHLAVKEKFRFFSYGDAMLIL